ncbi:putative aminoadipate reductase [Mycena pura]|uniref:Aminoadipate reductase n=1 Tax=Mycena pura TaxID=153505 RepID=A0AAD6UV42_9AGAR|nr:putative aminoadipate reductase [Mycena pura]
MPFAFPPAFATLRLPEAVAFNAKHNPDAPFYVFAEPEPSPDVGIITHLEFARASQRAAHLLRPNRAGPAGEVVALIAASDGMLYHAVVVGLLTANLVPFSISPRNSPAAIVQLLRKTGCRRIVSTCVTLAGLLAGVQKEWSEGDTPPCPLIIEEIPSHGQVYPHLGKETPSGSHAFEPYPPPAAQPDLDSLAMYLHSSGSTGFPKAIPQTQRILLQWATFSTVTDFRDHLPHPIAAMAWPPFHMGAIYSQLLFPIYAGAAVAVYPPVARTPHDLPVLPTPDSVLANARKIGCRSLVGVPAFFIQWAKSPEAVETLRSLGFVGVSGGSIPPRVGDALYNAGVNVVQLYASTELGAISRLARRAGDDEWDYAELSDLHKLRWVPQGDGTYELHVLRWDNHSVCVENLPDVPGYATSDLFVPHPEKAHLWKHVGRIDDVIVHSIGEKTVPAPMENIVMSSAFVSGTVMFGRDRAQAGILIEPIPPLQIDTADPGQVTVLRNMFWSLVEEANAIAPAFSRIYKEMILFTSKDKPLPRAGKGSVMRKAALSLYASEIDAVYDAVSEKGAAVDSVKHPAVWDVASINGWLLELARDLTGGADIAPDIDLFKQGFDSLNASFLRVRIAAALRSAKDPAVQKAVSSVEQNLIYSHPTIPMLSSFIEGAIAGKAGDPATDQIAAINAMIVKYSSGLAGHARMTESASAGDQIVLLTGSSGSLGSQILALLLAEESVAHIYAFNRPSSRGLSSPERHRSAFQDRGLDTTLLSSPKLSFVEGYTNLADLGLAADLYAEIRRSVTVIIHNAWMLDFNLTLDSFEAHIHGTRNLVDLALGASRTPRFVFTSSVSAVLSWDRARGACPEALTDLRGDVRGSTGYGQSKFVAEQIISRSGLHVSILRIGQVCGAPPRGAWASSDWFPILVKTSLALGSLPAADGSVSWIDFDTVSRSVLDAAFSHVADGLDPLMLNVVHPRPIPWNKVISGLQSALQQSGRGAVQVMGFPQWFALLEHEATQNQNVSQVTNKLPGIKLLQFFHQMADAAAASGGANTEFGMFDFSTDKIRDVSPAVRDARAIGEGHFNAWIGYWIEAGYI